ncbi:hypothetical protein [Iodobacter ciconiae]|uniref:hypothetical protein n=1 Tax=Iodobacter ciconiae TaxID=2496266 RepID=UPI0013DF4878|nr:hypothetical protein [Iodobacter ciconiae]
MLRPDLPADYAPWLTELKSRIQAAQQCARNIASPIKTALIVVRNWKLIRETSSGSK